MLKPEERKRLVENMSGSIAEAKPHIQDRAIANFSKVSDEFGRMLRQAVNEHNKKKAEQYRHHM